jgi:hypothetical protein
MVTDEQVRRLRKLSNTEKNQEIAASKAGMDPTTARRYLGLKKERQWRTREDPFGEVWDAVQQQIRVSPGLEAKTLFEWLQREYPGNQVSHFPTATNPFSERKNRAAGRASPSARRWALRAALKVKE